MINAFIFTKKYALREWKMEAPVKKKSEVNSSISRIANMDLIKSLPSLRSIFFIF